jgi:hypothetical protein
MGQENEETQPSLARCFTAISLIQKCAPVLSEEQLEGFSHLPTSSFSETSHFANILQMSIDIGNMSIVKSRFSIRNGVMVNITVFHSMETPHGSSGFDSPFRNFFFLSEHPSRTFTFTHQPRDLLWQTSWYFADSVTVYACLSIAFQNLFSFGCPA